MKRIEYNKGLIYSGFLAFFSYAILGSLLISPFEEFEITIFTLIFQGVGYILFILIGNVFYYLGPIADMILNKQQNYQFRARLFQLGYWFSCALPFIIPLNIIVIFFKRYY